MTYEELVAAAKKEFTNADASRINEHLAIQFNVTGEAAGAFYLEIKDGNISVEPYEYYDRDVIVTADAETLIKIASGKLGIEAAYLTGKIKAEGNLGKGLLLKNLGKKVVKKAATKKAAPKKAEPKTEKKAEAKTEKKVAAKKADAKKTK